MSRKVSHVDSPIYETKDEGVIALVITLAL
jgi:hypothetical protein